MMARIRFAGVLIAIASAFADKPSGSRNSSTRNSPGVMSGRSSPSTVLLRVVVDDFDVIALQRREYLIVEILGAFHPIPGSFFILEREDSRVSGIHHDADVPLHIGILPAIPILGVNIGMRIRRQILQRVEQKVFMFPVAEVRRGFTE